MLRTFALVALVLFYPFHTGATAPLVLDPDASEFEVNVKATGHSFEVVLDSYEATIDLKPSGELRFAEFSFASSALKSDNKKRDKKMLAWLESDSTPKIRFKLTEVQDRPSGRVGLGELSLHGVTRVVEVPFSVGVEGARATLSGSATIDYTEYGLEVITLFFMKVNPELTVSFTLVGTLES